MLIEKVPTLEDRFKAFKLGKSAAPIVHQDFQISVKANDNGKKVILTREEKDRDGETVQMDGMILRSWIKSNGLPLIDSHRMSDSVVANGLGALRNLRVEEVKGKNGLVGDPDFAPTPNGKIAEILYLGAEGGKPYFTNVSMGFAVYDYDNETRNITSWEPFEGSLVTVGANMSARFEDKSADEKEKETEEVIAKNLARFKQIQNPFKEFTKLFLNDEFCSKIGYQKDGDLLVDINSIYDIVIKQFEVKQVAPKVTEVAPKELLTERQIAKAIDDTFSKLGLI